MSCNACGSDDWIVEDDNGAEFPETRVEECKCHNCGHQFRNVLVA